ncbi:MAG: DEAD/DEAH box helicase [Candidatus Pacearchaeota archaeon]|nr:DEAD/DEAH box helicase [Candidatus Pacearchaeota archaeon]
MEFLEGIIPREYQQKIFETCIKKNCLVVLPTGLGKTLIALMLSIERMKQFPGEKVVFLAPTKPLVEQHLNYFKKHLSELFGEMNIFTGQINSGERKKLWQNSDIIFSTPQCVANDLNKKLYNLNDVCLLIEDEAHRCIKNYDYNYVAHEYIKQAKHPRIIGLTASPGSDRSKIKEICKNLSIEEVELKTRDSEDVKNYLQELKFEKIMLDFPPEFEEMRQVLLKLFEGYITELRTRKVLFGPASKTDLINLQKKISVTITRNYKNFNYMLGASACAQAIKIQHALELLETQTLEGFNKYLKNLLEQASKKQSKGVVKLVSKPEFNFVFVQSNELLSKKREHPKMQKLLDIIINEKQKNEKMKMIVFTQFRETASNLSKRINEIGGIKSKIFIGQAKKEGEGLNQKQQKKIIEEFSDGKIDILCATCIAEEGLDIPEVNIVVFYEPVPSAIRAIQRAGRTARLMKGKLIMLITKRTRDEAFFYVSKSREKKMKTAIQNIQEDMANGNLKYKSEKQETL